MNSHFLQVDDDAFQTGFLRIPPFSGREILKEIFYDYLGPTANFTHLW